DVSSTASVISCAVAAPGGIYRASTVLGQAVYWYFRQWRLDGTWRRIHTRLRERVRLHAGRDLLRAPRSSRGPSVKTHMGGLRGYDGNQEAGRLQTAHPVESGGYRRLLPIGGGLRSEHS